MTRASWRTMACLLAVGLGGIVVWADDPPAAPKPAKPSDMPKTYEREAVHTVNATPPLPPEPVVSAPTDPAPPPPIILEKPKDDLVPPPVQTVAAPQVIIPAPTTPSLSEPPAPPPMKLVPPLPPAPPTVAVVPTAPTIAPPPPMTVAPPPCSDKGCFDKPEIVRAEPDPPTKLMTPLPPPTPPTAPPLPMIEVARTVPSPAPAPMPSAAVTPMPHTLSPFPWKICLEFVNGVTQLEMRRGDEMLLRVQCEKLDLSTPSAGLHASGKVIVSGPCLEARCEKISIAWNSGQVALDGSVYLSFQNKGVVQVMRAESLCFRLTGANVPVEFTARDVHQMVGSRQ
ncbi:MAG: hypothetical protein U0746_22430 [Gemmataceae bacterium]